jgi:hypothetical protein
MKLINTGVTRHVILIGRYAIKIPRLNYGYRLFLLGLLANNQERLFSTMKNERIAPVLFYLPGGFLSIMPRCKLITDSEYEQLNLKDFENIPCEKSPGKSDSYGWLKGQIVALDYGS